MAKFWGQVYVCIVCICMFTSMWACVTYVWRPEVDVGCLLQLSFNLFNEVESLTEPKAC